MASSLMRRVTWTQHGAMACRRCIIWALLCPPTRPPGAPFFPKSSPWSVAGLYWPTIQCFVDHYMPAACICGAEAIRVSCVYASCQGLMELVIWYQSHCGHQAGSAIADRGLPWEGICTCAVLDTKVWCMCAVAGCMPCSNPEQRLPKAASQ